MSYREIEIHYLILLVYMHLCLSLPRENQKVSIKGNEIKGEEVEALKERYKRIIMKGIKENPPPLR
jgi:hypothetical protein